MPDTEGHFVVQRDNEDERRRAPRFQREEWIVAIVKAEGSMRKDEVYGRLRKVWGGTASRTFDDYVYAVSTSREVYIERNGDGTWLYSPAAWAERGKKLHKP